MNILKEIIVLVVIAITFGKFSFLFELGPYTPDLIFVYILLRSLNIDNIYISTLMGFLGGLIFDILGGFPPGLSSISYSLTGFIAVIFARNRENFTKREIFKLSISLLSFHYILRYLDIIVNADIFESFFRNIIPLILYTSLMQIIITYFLPFEKKRKML
ncbi:MAG: hypothetical protein CSA15_03845 [Candidatus Delongbacteria bacterium]|nr:MAG: hypothetical protein CSA15_03845 [Candidatus Delongbacteria bacterium]